MDITDEAVEAAKRGLQEHLHRHYYTPPCGDRECFAMCDRCKESEARAALEAAAPFIAARAWDEGRRHGATYPYGERGLATDDNPHRVSAL